MALLKILSKFGSALINNWKLVLIGTAILYVIFLEKRNNTLKTENLTLSATVFKQDSLLSVQSNKLYQDSVVYVSQIHDLQSLVKETSDNNKKILQENKDLRSVILGNKCLKSGLFGKKINITNCD